MAEIEENELSTLTVEDLGIEIDQIDLDDPSFSDAIKQFLDENPDITTTLPEEPVVIPPGFDGGDNIIGQPVMPEEPVVIPPGFDGGDNIIGQPVMPEEPIAPDIIQDIINQLIDPTGWQPIAGTGDGVLLNTGAAEGGWTNINDLTGDNPVLEIGGIELHS